MNSQQPYLRVAHPRDEAFDVTRFDDDFVPAPTASAAVAPYMQPQAPAVIPHGVDVVIDADGRPRYVRSSSLPAIQQPQRDVWPARLLCGGIGTGAAGLGVGYMMHEIAMAVMGLAALAAVLAAGGYLLRSASGGKRGDGGSGGWSISGNGNHVRIGR